MYAGVLLAGIEYSYYCTTFILNLLFGNWKLNKQKKDNTFTFFSIL